MAGGASRCARQALELLPGGVLQGEPDPDAGAQGQEVFAPQEIGEATVAGEDDGEQRAGVELGAGQQAQLAEHGGEHLLGLVDEEHGP